MAICKFLTNKYSSNLLSCKFCNKKQEFGKKICPAWRKEVTWCKNKNDFAGSLVYEESKKRKGLNKNNSTNFAKINDYSSDEPLFTVIQHNPTRKTRSTALMV